MEYHEYANLFPMMTEGELEELCEDMQINGYDKSAPITMLNGKILDGRNRQVAADRVGVEPYYLIFTGTDSEALDYVIRHNLKRRHLNETQRAVIAGRLANIPKHIHKTDMQICISQQDAASMLNVSPRTVATVKAIEKSAPQFIERMAKGEMTANQARTEMKRIEIITRLDNIEVKEAKEIFGIYDAIVIDPPWPMEKIERDERPNQTEFEYPTMTIEEIKALDIHAANDCHIWLWTTHKFLPEALEILKAWDLKYICTFVWHKPGGFQPWGLPQYNCEFCLYARKGSPIFIDAKQFNTCFNAPRGAHSEKPEDFYNMVRRVTGGRRLDMFNRRKIEGFDGWGKEAL